MQMKMNQHVCDIRDFVDERSGYRWHSAINVFKGGITYGKHKTGKKNQKPKDDILA